MGRPCCVATKRMTRKPPTEYPAPRNLQSSRARRLETKALIFGFEWSDAVSGGGRVESLLDLSSVFVDGWAAAPGALILDGDDTPSPRKDGGVADESAKGSRGHGGGSSGNWCVWSQTSPPGGCPTAQTVNCCSPETGRSETKPASLSWRVTPQCPVWLPDFLPVGRRSNPVGGTRLEAGGLELLGLYRRHRLVERLTLHTGDDAQERADGLFGRHRQQLFGRGGRHGHQPTV